MTLKEAYIEVINGKTVICDATVETGKKIMMYLWSDGRIHFENEYYEDVLPSDGWEIEVLEEKLYPHEILKKLEMFDEKKWAMRYGENRYMFIYDYTGYYEYYSVEQINEKYNLNIKIKE